MAGNQLWDLAAMVARSNPLSVGAPGVNNSVTLEINGEGNKKSGPAEFFANSVPFDPDSTNTVQVFHK